MRISKLVVTLSVLALVAVGGCNKKKEGEGGGGGGEASGGGASEMTADAFFKDFTSLEGMDAINKYKDGVVVSGPVLRTGEEGDGSMFVHLDAGGGKWVALSFTDKGAAAKAKGVKQGDTVKARCKVGGADANYVMNTDCELM
ncbi:MAG TPA: hypothetical protein VFU21_07720 [Kofleriaceae bacterium]|nr:hypothetical protein [Kofleriaceae bacterium]